jgi:putative ABC transport system substrate-binding protein
MRRRAFLVALGGAAVAAEAKLVQALEPRIYTIGVLIPGNQGDQAVRFLRQGMRDLGYVEGKNLRLDIRSASTLPA